MKQRISIIDALKGIAIIAVALYHYGGRYLPYGYLGVDIFFVVGGYLLISSLKRQMEKGVLITGNSYLERLFVCGR